MTHTLHRRGPAETLCQDFVVLSMPAKTVNALGSGPKMKQIFEILGRHPHVNFGEVKTGSKLNSDRATVFAGVKEGSVVHYAFSDRAALKAALADLKAAEIGISVVVSGLEEEVAEICREVGLSRHTVEYSGGVLGRTERLAEEPILEITTMCGHGLVAANLVKDLARRVKRGKLDLDAAAAELARPCMCGVFNPLRAKALLAKFVEG